MSASRACRSALPLPTAFTLAAALWPTGASGAEEGADASGLHLGLRTGFGVPLGRYADVRTQATVRDTDVNSLGDDTHGVIPLWVDAGYRLSPHVMVGGYFMYGVVLPKTAPQGDPLGGGCPEGFDCFASGIRFGVQAQYRFSPGESLSPWLGLGIGYERIHSELDGELFSFPFEASASHSGPDLLQLQGGVDFALGSAFAAGPFAAASAMQYTSCTLELAGAKSSCELDDSGWHGWLVFGVRASLEP